MNASSPDRRAEEILISSHICHPSLANDNLSGVAVATFLARALAGTERRYTYRFLFAPGTIGAITWLARNEDKLGRIRGGLVLACVGDSGPIVYKRSRRGDTAVDRAAEARPRDSRHASRGGRLLALWQRRAPILLAWVRSSGGRDHPLRLRSIRAPSHVGGRHGGDQPRRPGGDAAVLSEDRCRFSRPNSTFISRNPKGEPQLGRRGLYRSLGGRVDQSQIEAALLWVMSFADGRHSLLDIAHRAGVPFEAVHKAAEILERAELLSRKDVRP